MDVVIGFVLVNNDPTTSFIFPTLRYFFISLFLLARFFFYLFIFQSRLYPNSTLMSSKGRAYWLQRRLTTAAPPISLQISCGNGLSCSISYFLVNYEKPVSINLSLSKFLRPRICPKIYLFSATRCHIFRCLGLSSLVAVQYMKCHCTGIFTC